MKNEPLYPEPVLVRHLPGITPAHRDAECFRSEATDILLIAIGLPVLTSLLLLAITGFSVLGVMGYYVGLAGVTSFALGGLALNKFLASRRRGNATE